jgi:putative component of membrane protein insertase Oxa1/YidC/SpoIIIJ protein YidD
MIDALILQTIGIYQRHISPRKGWRCAYSVLHGGCGCSGYVRTEIEKQGWIRTRRLARKRFEACKKAGRILRLQSGDPFGGGGGTPTPQPGNPTRGRGRRWCNNASDSVTETDHFCTCLDFIFDCGPGDTGCCDCDSPCN